LQSDRANQSDFGWPLGSSSGGWTALSAVAEKLMLLPLLSDGRVIYGLVQAVPA